LQIQQFIEGETAPPAFGVLERVGAVNRLERLGQRRKPVPSQGLWKNVRCEADQLIEMPVDQPPDRLVAQPFGGGIDRKHPAAERFIAVRVLIGQDDELSRGELASVIEADRAGDQKGLSDFDGAIEKGLTGPGTLEQTALVFEDRVEIRSPRRVGSNRLATTRPMQATSSPTRALASGVMVDASR
jgi:hypothetical protein